MKWLLIRGLGRQKKHWHDFTPLLNTHSEGVLCIDLPGVGDNKDAPTPHTISGHTDFLRTHFLNHKKDDEKWGVLGISLGGMIALDWAARFSDDFKRAVVINSSSNDTGHILQRFSIYTYYRLIRTVISSDPIERENEIMKMVSNLRVDDKPLLQKFAEIRQNEPVSKSTLSKQLFAASQFMLPTKITIPVLILASLKDNMVDVRCSKQIASHLKAKIKIHPTAGHDLTLDDPDWCIKQITENI